MPTCGSNAESVAEHALLLILSLLRQLPAAQANVRAGILGAPMGRMLAGRRVCLWRLGATALALARRLRALANVIATPHVAGVTEQSYGEIAQAVVANIERLRRSEPLLNRVV